MKRYVVSSLAIISAVICLTLATSSQSFWLRGTVIAAFAAGFVFFQAYSRSKTH